MIFINILRYLTYLIARNVDYGKKAIEELQKLGLEAKYHQLDIQNLESINKFAAYINENYGGIDVLVNNAAILVDVILNFVILKSLTGDFSGFGRLPW